MKQVIGLVGALLLSFAFVSSSLADKGDHYRSRQALQAGEIMPLSSILEKVEQQYPGQVLEVELERYPQQSAESPAWFYEVKVLPTSGRLQKIRVNAKTGEMIELKPKPRHPQKMMKMREMMNAHPNR